MVDQKMQLQERVDQFLSAGPPFAVIGASCDREKYGNKVLRCYLQNNLTVYPINPKEKEVEGVKAYRDLFSLPERVASLSIITPPHVTEKFVSDAIQLGVGNIWMQPGAENKSAIKQAEKAGLNVIFGGPCLLVVLGYHEGGTK